MDVEDWLRGLGFERYQAAFRENDVDAELLLGLTDDDLKDIGVNSLGHRRRLLEAIAGLRPERAPASDPRPATHAAGSLSDTSAERRPLSVMFCDLIGSTALWHASIRKICGRLSDISSVCRQHHPALRRLHHALCG